MKSDYHKAICEQMNKFAEDTKTIFLGQQVASEDFYDTLVDVPLHQRLEMPVAEDMQLGMSIGLSLEGYLPISIFQRMDFLPRAFDQLVNHLNLIAPLTDRRYIPKVIIRTTIGSTKPLDVGLQHSGDLTSIMRTACKFPVFLVKTVEEVNTAYNFARHSKESTMIIELQDNYFI